MKIFFSDRAAGLNGNATREIFKLLSNPNMISFAGGLPAPECLPMREVARLSAEILASDAAARVLQYGTTDGIPWVRKEMASYLADFGISGASLEDTIVVSGGQQAIDLTFKAFLNKGDVVLVEDPTYLAVLQIAQSYEARTVGVRSADDGLELDDLEKKLKRLRPKVLYVVPTFSNPTGKTYSVRNRQGIAELSAKYGCVVLEDDPYSKLRFEGDSVPSIRSMDTAGNVVFSASFSKLISPGLRVAALNGPAEIIRKLEVCKQGTDVHTSHLSQAIVGEYLKQGLLARDLHNNVPKYKHKKDKMIEAIQRYMPAEFKYANPHGGLFIWGAFPEKVDTAAAFKTAVSANVAYVSGNVFYADGRGGNTMRLNFSNSDDEKIDRGVRVLGEVFKKLI